MLERGSSHFHAHACFLPSPFAGCVWGSQEQFGLKGVLTHLHSRGIFLFDTPTAIIKEDEEQEKREAAEVIGHAYLDSRGACDCNWWKELHWGA